MGRRLWQPKVAGLTQIKEKIGMVQYDLDVLYKLVAAISNRVLDSAIGNRGY